MTGPRYILRPGFVRSRADGDRHYIGVDALLRLYSVPPDARRVVADAMAVAWAKSRGVRCIGFLANWREFGRAAGPMRNAQMVAYGLDGLVAFPGGRGTADMNCYSPPRNFAISAVRKYTRRPSFILAALICLAHLVSFRRLTRSPSAERSSTFASWAMLSSGPYWPVSASSMCIRWLSFDYALGDRRMPTGTQNRLYES